MIEQSEQFQQLTQEIHRRQLEHDPQLRETLDERAIQKMYQDVQYNVDFLRVAMQLETDTIFANYARWMYQLLSSLMTYCTREQLRDRMVYHYELIRTCMVSVIPKEMQPKLHRLLDLAVCATREECERDTEPQPGPMPYEDEITRYIDCLLQADTKGAIGLVADYIKAGIPLEDICVDIVAEAMRRVGELWHRHQVSVDMEYYCTSTTQMALSQLYPIIFNRSRKGKTVVVACVGSELHEMGARMVADLFEYNGWDSVYLGAAVPVKTILAAVSEHKPLVVALSVTMPQHLPICRDTIGQLRKAYPELKIAVGGNGFSDTDIWKHWKVDQYTKDARALVEWADGLS